MAAREQVHRLVDTLREDALDAAERVLSELPSSSTTRPSRLAAGETPTDDRAAVASADAAEKRLRSFFRRFEGRSLANELIAERQEEARRESS